MNLLQDILTYVRRLIKSPSNAQITDALLIDYINRFWLMDVDARMQLFDLKTTYKYMTIPGISKYNMPLYDLQTEPGSQTISYYPMYQGFMDPVWVNGIQCPFYTTLSAYYNLWPNYLQNLQPAAIGDGTVGPYTINIPYFPAIPGHVDMTGIVAAAQYTGIYQDPLFNNTLLSNPNAPYNTHSVVPLSSVDSGIYFMSSDQSGNNIIVQDSGQFLSGNTGGDLYGLLMSPGNGPYGCIPLSGGYSITSNTVNYVTGVANVTFPTAIPEGTPINAGSYFYEQGIPRALCYYNNVMILEPPPNTQWLVECTAYLTPAAFFDSNAAIPFAYMAEYISRGAARKILADTGDIEQFQFYEPLFKEQESLVWKRSQRIFTSSRTPTIFSETQGQTNYNNIGSGTN